MHLANILASPSEVFQDLDASPRWRMPLLLMVVGSLITGWYMVPALLEPMRKIYGSAYGERAAANAAGGLMKPLLLLQLVVAPLGTLLRWIVLAGFLSLLSRAAVRGKPEPFAKYFSLVAYAETIFILMGALTTLILYARGIEHIEGMSDLTVFKGLDQLLPHGTGGGVLLRLLAEINPFSVWYVVTLASGVAVVTRVRTAAALAIAGTGWAGWLLAGALRAPASDALFGLITGYH
jgi:hypothetical protein